MTAHFPFLGNFCIPIFKGLFVYVFYAINITNVFHSVTLALYMVSEHLEYPNKYKK